MVKKTPINCPHCGEFVINEETIMFYVLPPEGLKCLKCKKIVIEGRRINY